MRILLTNDDGIHAPGLATLETVARTLSDDVWVVAPESEQSGAAHSLSLNDPLRIRQVAERRFAVKGTPTDCVIMAVRRLLAENKPDLVLSGVNRGQNLAEDVTYSGTVAGATEGALLGIPSIALSQAYGFSAERKVRWQTAETLSGDLIRRVYEAGIAPGVLLNVNFPDVDPAEVRGTVITRQGRRDQDLLNISERHDGRGNPYYWIGIERRRSAPAKGTDLWAIYEGYVSVTPLGLDLTHKESCEHLNRVLEDSDG